MNCLACGQPLPEGIALCPHCGHDSSPPGPSQGPPNPLAETPPTSICPRCAHVLSKSTGYCPNCGALINASGQWPPPPSGYSPAPLPPARNIGSLVGGFFAGFAVTLFGGVVYGLGLIIAIALYFVFRQNQPSFARGWGFGILAAVAIVLGVFAICMWTLTHMYSSGT